MLGIVLGALLVSATLVGRVGLGLTSLAFVGSVLMVGAMQWLVLRDHCPGVSMRSWLGATVAGHFASGLAAVAMLLPGILGALRALASFAGPDAIAFVTTVAIGAVAGAVSGCAGWIILRRHFAGAGVWVLASAFAGAMAALAPAPRPVGDVIGVPLAPVAARASAGLITACVTGAALAWLVRRRSERTGPLGLTTRRRGSATSRRPSAQ